MDRWYRVGVKFHSNDRARYIKGMCLPWHTTSYRYGCRLFSRSIAVGLRDRLNSDFHLAQREWLGGGYAFIEEA
jgi:hypothetical protein